ncbi:MAG: GGDEF domain-containing protein [Candidatus Gastranaerophilales bacterium]|nr:GGDEF domain-containing protein [Candidatus Gastranaerophilales bacterium]
MQKLSELDFIWEVSQILSCSVSSAEIFAGLQSLLKENLNINNINIICFDFQQNSFCNFLDNQEPFTKNELNHFQNIFKQLNSTIRLNFILNDEFFVIEDDFNLDSKINFKRGKNIFYIPLIRDYKCIGFMELNKKSTNEDYLTNDFIKALFIVASQISNVVTNKQLNLKISKIADFYKAQKNIAKILETQYEYSFLIPVIGDILDNFAKNYFTYIFMKNENGKFELAWPLRYDKKRLNPILDSISGKNKIILSDDKTQVLFPVFFENVMQGAIIIDGKTKQISQDDIDFLAQLSMQTATTLDKAGVYAEIEKFATQDALTGLNNRRSLDLRINQEVAVAKRKNLPLCVMMLDVDFFKKANDTYGHYVGDVVLKHFAEIINDEVREYDFPARYGGEEFFIILPSTTIDEAKKVADRLRERIEKEEFDISKFNNTVKTLHITTSIGLTSLENDIDVKKLYVNVDKALYEAKQTGRNRVIVK